MSFARLHWPSLILGLALSARAQGQTALSSSPRNGSQGSDELNGGRWFQLTLPAIGLPLKATWLSTPAPTFELSKLPMYRWELGTLDRGPVSFRGFNQIQPAIDLNCLGLVCETKLERVLGAEGRLNLGGSGVLPSNYLFVKPEFILDAVRNSKRVRMGFGGDLDL